MRLAVRLAVLALPLAHWACRAQPVTASVRSADEDTEAVPAAPYTGTYLAEARLAALPPTERDRWQRYVLQSRQAMALDQATLAAEVRQLGLAAARRAPNTAANFEMSSAWTAAWTRSDAGRALVAAVLSYQTPTGGWGKHLDYTRGPRPRGTSWNSESDTWSYVGTIDNGATVNELRLLAVASSAAPGDSALGSAFVRGVEYLLQAQYPSGCWPQVYPLMGSYHDAATHNDDATVNVVRLLRDVARGVWTIASTSLRTKADDAVGRAVTCLVAQQVRSRDVLTTWAQQHDPLTHMPVAGRAYELAALTGQEGARIMALLMDISPVTPAMLNAVHAAAAFYRATAIENVVYVSGTGLVATPNAGPVWSRLMDLDTWRPIFANRDGIKLFDHDQLTDRRTGYAWYGTVPAASLRTFDTWSRAHPLTR